MIKPINTLSQNNNRISFKRVPTYRGGAQKIGHLKFGTINQTSATQNAILDIINTIRKHKTTEAFTNVLKSFNGSIKNGIQFLSLVGAGSIITLFTQKNDENKDILGIKINSTATEEKEEIFLIDADKVINPKSKKGDFYTQAELESLNIESKLNEILDKLDIPLLRLRQALLPKIKVDQQLIKRVEKYKKENTSENIKISSTSSLAKTATVPCTKTQKTKFSNPQASVEKFNTSQDVDRYIAHLISTQGKDIKASSLSVKTKDGTIGKVSPEFSSLMNDISNLVNSINEKYTANPSIAKMLKNRTSTFDFIRKHGFLNLRNLGDDKLGVTIGDFFSHKTQKVIKVLTIKDSSGKNIDILPISGEKIHKMLKSYDPSTAPVVSYISSNKFLSQQEINSKDIIPLLKLVKSELENQLDLIINGGAIINESLQERLKSYEDSILGLREKAISQKFKSYAIHFNKDGSYTLKNINNNNDYITYLPGSQNERAPGVTLIQVFDKRNRIIDSISIHSGKYLKNYPTKYSKYVPRTFIYYSKNEISSLNLESKLEEQITFLENQFVMLMKALETYTKNMSFLNKF